MLVFVGLLCGLQSSTSKATTRICLSSMPPMTRGVCIHCITHHPAKGEPRNEMQCWRLSLIACTVCEEGRSLFPCLSSLVTDSYMSLCVCMCVCVCVCVCVCFVFRVLRRVLFSARVFIIQTPPSRFAMSALIMQTTVACTSWW